MPIDSIIAGGINLKYIIDAYRNPGMKPLREKFFSPFFDKLTGSPAVRRMIQEGASADEIRRTWAADVERFRLQRKPYLLYPE